MSANIIEFSQFESISDFKWSMKCGGEAEFEWNGKEYSIVSTDEGLSICEANRQETVLISRDAEKILDYIIDGKKLREIITDVKVNFRAI